jgi:putative tricarboxylic transport membrane protein
VNNLSKADFLAERLVSLAFAIIGAVVAFYGWSYGIGELNNIGPGAFPLGLGLLLIAFSLPNIVSPQEVLQTFNIKPVICILLGVAAWGLLIDFGLLLATLTMIAIVGLSYDTWRPTFLIPLALSLTAGGYVIFVLGFNLPITLFGG